MDFLRVDTDFINLLFSIQAADLLEPIFQADTAFAPSIDIIKMMQ